MSYRNLAPIAFNLHNYHFDDFIFVGSKEAPSKDFLLFFLLSDWLKLNHLKSRMECGFSDIFSRHICCTVAETIHVTNYTANLARKYVQTTTIETAEIILGPWNQQIFKPSMCAIFWKRRFQLVRHRVRL